LKFILSSGICSLFIGIGEGEGDGDGIVLFVAADEEDKSESGDGGISDEHFDLGDTSISRYTLHMLPRTGLFKERW
jgi:hypothetical protein